MTGVFESRGDSKSFLYLGERGYSLGRGLAGFLAPDAGETGGELLVETLDQFAVGGDQTLLGFDLQYDLLLRRQQWERD